MPLRLVMQPSTTCSRMDDKWDMINQGETLSGGDSIVLNSDADFIGWITEIQVIGREGTLSPRLTSWLINIWSR